MYSLAISLGGSHRTTAMILIEKEVQQWGIHGSQWVRPGAVTLPNDRQWEDFGRFKTKPAPEGEPTAYLTYLRLYRQGVDTANVVADMVDIVNGLRNPAKLNIDINIDVTVPGRIISWSIKDFLVSLGADKISPTYATIGGEASVDGKRHYSRRTLSTGLDEAYRARRLIMSQDLPGVDRLVSAMSEFKLRAESLNEFDFVEQEDDSLVLAAGLAYVESKFTWDWSSGMSMMGVPWRR